MYLHDDKEIFKEIIEQVAAETGRTEIIIEKDYYVTMLLKNLANKLSNVVFINCPLCQGHFELV